MRVTRCDGDGCTREWIGHYANPDEVQSMVIEIEANEDADHGQFCSWSCLAAWATQRAIDREAVES